MKSGRRRVALADPQRDQALPTAAVVEDFDDAARRDGAHRRLDRAEPIGLAGGWVQERSMRALMNAPRRAAPAREISIPARPAGHRSTSASRIWREQHDFLASAAAGRPAAAGAGFLIALIAFDDEEQRRRRR